MYGRLVLTCYLITLGLIGYSPTYYMIKLILVAAVLAYCLFDFRNKSACTDILEIRLSPNQWVLMMDGRVETYDCANIIIHNVLFQLIQLTHLNQRKLVVLFNDQLSTDQLRLMHLKIATAPNLC